MSFSDLPIFEAPVQVQVLKVHINCDGCERKVKKLLRKIEGVYKVDIDTKRERVTVTGTVDSDTLIKKLEKSGKHAEILWPPNNYQIQPNHEPDWIKYGKVLNQMQGPMKGLRGSERRPAMGPPCGPEVDAYYGHLNQEMGRRQQQPLMANSVMDNLHMGAIDGYSMDGNGNMHDMKSMMGFQGFSDSDAGLPCFEHHRPSSYMMLSNMQGGPHYNQQSQMMNPMMNMNMDMYGMQPRNNPMMNMDMYGTQPMKNPTMNLNQYMHLHQPQRINSPVIPNNDCYGNFSYVPYMSNM